MVLYRHVTKNRPLISNSCSAISYYEALDVFRIIANCAKHIDPSELRVSVLCSLQRSFIRASVGSDFGRSVPIVIQPAYMG